MHSHQLNLRVDLRDVQLFAELLRDRPQLHDRLVRFHSDVWGFQGSDSDCEEVREDVADLLRDVQWLEPEFELAALASSES